MQAPAYGLGVIVALGCALSVSATYGHQAQDRRTVRDAVFTEAQAERGRILYQEQCVSCHLADLKGAGAPELAGADFLKNWDGLSVFDLVSKIGATMPANAPGSMSRQQATDLAAFVLSANRFPAGPTELATDRNVQQVIAIVK